MDFFSRKIIAWTISEIMDVSSVTDTIRKAKERRTKAESLIIYNDCGSQYVKGGHRGKLRSYSHKGYSYGSTCIESFHSLIKREWLNRFRIANFEVVKQLVFEYIETLYNTVRIHSHCNYLSPDQYEKKYQEMIRQNVKLAG